MRLNRYQEEASRTLPPNTEPRAALNLGALGLGGEAGEAIDLIKKHLFHGQPLDVDKFRKELGDVLWYVSALATGAGLTLEDVAEANVAKLRARYPEGFSPAASVARADEAKDLEPDARCPVPGCAVYHRDGSRACVSCDPDVREIALLEREQESRDLDPCDEAPEESCGLCGGSGVDFAADGSTRPCPCRA